jgi:hypothetical protein
MMKLGLNLDDESPINSTKVDAADPPLVVSDVYLTTNLETGATRQPLNPGLDVGFRRAIVGPSIIEQSAKQCRAVTTPPTQIAEEACD